MRRSLLWALSLASLTLGVGLCGQQFWIAGKGWLAERLIADAWTATLESGVRHRPWSWADTHPIAQIEVPHLGISRIVLEGATGASLAFGPGHVDGSALPNERGNSVIAGHRDDAFSFLARVRVGDLLHVRSTQRSERYSVTATLVVDELDLRWLGPSPEDRLTLITCYPFGGLSGGTERFVVLAARDRSRDGVSGS